MGRERTGSGKHLFIYIACAVVVYSVFSSCTRLPLRLMEEFNFRKADSLMNEGQYAAALAENKRIYANGPVSHNDQAIYRMALIYTHNANNLRDVYLARKYFTRILTDYPASPLRSKAKFWIQMIDKLESSQKEIANLNSGNTILSADNASLSNDIASLSNDNTILRDENADLKIKIEEREKKLNLLENVIIELENQIENLKQIDLSLEQKKSKGVP